MTDEKFTYNLFLDDMRLPYRDCNYTNNPIYKDLHWLVVINYEQFVGTIEKYYNLKGILPNIISFDHDLADVHYGVQDHLDDDYYDLCEVQDEKTGYHCAKWLVNFCMDNDLKLPEYYAHSMNTVGRRNILGYLNNYVKFCKTQNNG